MISWLVIYHGIANSCRLRGSSIFFLAWGDYNYQTEVKHGEVTSGTAIT